MSRFSQLLIGIILLAIGIMGLLYYYPGMMNSGGMRSGMMGEMMRSMEETGRKTDFSSNGERIYYTGINATGRIIKNSSGMERVGCAMCHGADAQGMRMMMIDTPALKWDYLVISKGHSHPNGRRHPPFTESSFKSCVLAGIDPAGNRLSTMMPRWEMSNNDLNDLIKYLKTK